MTEKRVRLSAMTFFFFFWRSYYNLDKTAFSPSALEFTKPEIRHILAGPGPTFRSRRPWLQAKNAKKKLKLKKQLFFGTFLSLVKFKSGGGGSWFPSSPSIGYAYVPIEENEKGVSKISARFLAFSNKISTV